MRIANITFAFEQRRIFESLTLDIDPGINLVIGPSGSGKTSLLKILFGTLVASSITWESIFPRKLLVLQDDALLPWLSGWDNLLQFLRKRQIERQHISESRLFPLVADFLDRKTWEMSFGQRRTVELVRAILFEPDILLLDEPLNFLDPKRKELIADVLFEINATKYTIITTHETSVFKPYLNSALFIDGEFPVGSLRRIPI